MKKLILAAFALTTAASVFAQGTILFNIRSAAGSLHVWGPSPTAPSLSLVGLGSNDGPVTGTTPFSQSGMTMIGAGGSGGKYGYATTFAQVLSANGGNQPESALAPSTATTTFRSGTSLGAVAGITATLNNVPADSPLATLRIAAWDNSSGLYPTWLLAKPAWEEGLIAAGLSPVFNLANIGGSVNTPPVGLNPGGSWNLYFNVIPEPSTFALAGLGAAAMLILRRRNSK